MKTRFLATILAATMAACTAAPPVAPPAPMAGTPAFPLFEGLGNNGRPITTQSRLAQRYFDQGLSFLYAFNHDEAVRAFRAAADFDPGAAMAWWGIAIASGPHINNPTMTPEASRTAMDALRHAQQQSAGAGDVERALIVALASRYSDPAPADRAQLDQAYAASMREVWKRYPDDPDVGALFAESLMDLRPWNQWTPAGKPQPGTAEVLSTLERVMKLQPDHPLALHLYIHAVEASRDPARAEAAADRLRDLQPGLGHLVHMPSHIDVRLGHWQKAVAANAKAIVADDSYLKRAPHQHFYLLYVAHNHHMLAFAAMMIGHRAEAVHAIDTMMATLPPDWVRQSAAIADGYAAMPLEVRVRFGMWDEILAAPDFPEYLPFARAMRHYARAVALSAQGDTKQARGEQRLFATARKAVPADARFGNNSAPELLAVADKVLEGEIGYREGKRPAAFASLRRAVQLEDKLQYDEPPSWILPARHTLGAALLDAGRGKEAEPVFRADLERHPHNGWALFGLARSLRAQGRNAEAARVEAEFDQVWAGADTEISSPCACLAKR